MSIKSIVKKVWNSNAMDTFADITMGTLECLGEVICDTFSNNNSHTPTKDYYTQTYEYWKHLDYEGQQYYFESNEYLKDYIKNDYYPNDRELTARHVAHIADKLNRSFTEIDNRY